MTRFKFLLLAIGLTVAVGAAFFVVVFGSVGLNPETLAQQAKLNQANTALVNQQKDELAIEEPVVVKEQAKEPEFLENKEDELAEKVPQSEHTIKVLSVPFMAQAPQANWSMPYQEACEEASMIMVAEYLQGNKSMRLSAEQADKLILELVEWETERGYNVDLTAAEVVSVLSEKFQIKSQVVPFDIDVVKQELKGKRPVIIPAAGQDLGNPYFTPPGPLYHMLVIKGYEGDEFIVNDPGTRRGESYRYHQSVLGNAVHDWNGGNVSKGGKLMIVLKEVSS